MTAIRTPGKVQLALILGGLSAFGPLSIDMYLPAFPSMATELGAGQAQVQITLTAFLIGLAGGQVIAGPLSDSMGRRKPLLIGLALYTLSSLACAIAPTVYALAALRLAQGLTAAAGVVIARATARDLYGGVAMARFLSMMALVNGLGPILAPLIGGQVLRWTTWPGVFIVLAGFGVLLLVVTGLSLPDTLPVHYRRPARFTSVMKTYARIATDRTFMAYAAANGFVLGALFAYISGSSFVLQDGHGLSPQQFSLVFGLNALGLLLMAQLNGLLLRRFSPRRLLTVGLLLSATGGVWVLTASLTGVSLGWLLPGMFLVVCCAGMVMPNATALALADHAHRAGTASALLGLLQFIIGGLAAPLVGLGGQSSAVAMSVVIASLSCLGLFSFALTRPTAQRPGRYQAMREAHTEPIPLPQMPDILRHQGDLWEAPRADTARYW